MIRIGIYGNNLNQGYFLAGLFRELGADAKVFIPNYAHAQDTHSWWSAQDMDESLVVRLSDVVDTGASGPLCNVQAVRNIYAEAEEFDVLVLREEGPALFSELSGVAKVFAAQGADLQLWPWWLKTNLSPRALWHEMAATWRFPPDAPLRRRVGAVVTTLLRRLRSLPWMWRRQERQRTGIRQCSRSIVFPYQRYLLDALHYPRDRVHYIPLPNTPPDVLDDKAEELPSALQYVCDNADLLFVHPARMFFLRRDGNLFQKDNDKLLHAFADFVGDYVGKAHLILFEKGLEEDLQVAKRLVSDLGIADLVVWLPELTNRELRTVLHHPKSIVCDQYSPYLNALGNLGRESVYFGRPLITSYDGEDDPMYTAPPPNVFFGNTPQTVALAMRQVANMSAADLSALKTRCSEWYQLNLDPLQNAQRYLEVCAEAVNATGMLRS